MAKAIDDEIFDTTQQLGIFVGYGLHVGDVSKIVDAETYDGQFAMHDPNRHYLHVSFVNFGRRCLSHVVDEFLALHLDGLVEIFGRYGFFGLVCDDERLMGTNRYQFDGWHARIAFFLWCETIRDALKEMVDAKLFGIDIYIAKYAVWTQVIQSAHMVVVLMSNEDRIERAELYVEHLLTKVGTAVYKYVAAMVLNKSRTAETLVFRVGRRAHVAMATYLWHTTRGACS